MTGITIENLAILEKQEPEDPHIDYTKPIYYAKLYAFDISKLKEFLLEKDNYSRNSFNKNSFDKTWVGEYIYYKKMIKKIPTLYSEYLGNSGYILIQENKDLQCITELTTGQFLFTKKQAAKMAVNDKFYSPFVVGDEACKATYDDMRRSNVKALYISQREQWGKYGGFKRCYDLHKKRVDEIMKLMIEREKLYVSNQKPDDTKKKNLSKYS